MRFPDSGLIPSDLPKITYYTKDGKFYVDDLVDVPFCNLHRTNGPAFKILWSDSSGGTKYYRNGLLHRDAGPALVYWNRLSIDGKIISKSYEKWYQNGLAHRTDGPAYTSWNPIGSLSFERWHFNGNLHRLDGPAYIDHEGGGKYWFIDGVSLSEKFFLENHLNPYNITEEDLLKIRLLI